MGRKLASYVNVDNTWYGPDDDVPADVAKQITNESAWATEDSPSEGAKGATVAKPAPKTPAKP